ncbi:toll/interleukin-1 receptor domain-containing protein [Halomonas sp. BM-2019]|uniref:tetratricopeptide repeat protein n=1 Tax=Halomonas sp. BM-2019 TaxID=2811227 RepID=UPI001B3C3103|nr:MAG: toll/interleukin-1 receptor domain-containing protein [Halomonas sp. BM-2019]
MNPATPPPWDLFISYRRTDADIVDALAAALERAGVGVWLDRSEIDDADSIQARIDQGLANSRALLAWYSADYPHSRPCQWELTAALIAARGETAPVRRLLVVNPEIDADHLVLPELRDIEHLSAPAGVSDAAGVDTLAERIVKLLQPIQGTFGARALARPPWHGYAALGSNRFVGRVQALWDIHAALSAGDFAIVSGQPAPVSRGQLAQVRGSGGIGKSLLAEEYALRFGAFWPGGVFWLRAYGHSDRPEESAAALAQRRDDEYRDQLGNFALAQGVDIRELDTRQIRALLTNRLQELGPYLWIVDDLPDGDRAELERWLAPSSNGQTLLTTRSRRHDALGKPIDLGLLPHSDARALLTRDHAPQDDAERKAVEDILTRLEGHALALDVARAACQRQGYQGFLARLQQPDRDALALAAELAGELPNGHNPSIAVTFLGSIQALPPEGLDFLRLCAQLAAAPVERSLVARCLAIVEGLEEETAEDRADLGMHQAIQASLAEAVRGRQAATVHTLIARTLRLHDAAETDRQRALREAALNVLASDLEQVTDIRHHDALQDALAHARVLAEQPGTAAEYALTGWLGRYELERANYRDAERLYRQQSEGYTRLFSEAHPDTLTSMNNLAVTLRDLGDLAAARVLHELVLAACRRVLGEEHPHTLSSMNNLAGTLRAQGDLAAARALQEQVLAARRRVLGEEHTDTSITAWNLLMTLYEMQDDPAAHTILDENLLWLLQRDPTSLTADQREIREMLRDALSG